VDHGTVLSENLRREGISDRELAVALRQNQLMTPDEAEFVYLETNGQISVIPWRDEPGAEEAAEDDAAAESVGDAARRPGRPRRRHRVGRLTGTG
jgi:uncharacterized membrane protein YcaP (DUF421 family)